MNALDNECERLYGVTPGDVDANGIIDAVEGGCGHSSGMKAQEYDAIMREYASS